jgi:hypothetical protein
MTQPVKRLATRYMTVVRFQAAVGTFVLAVNTSKSTLGPKHAPTQRVLGAISPAAKRSEREADYPLPSTVNV